MATAVRSFSKVNLGLAIGPVRPDGYHGLTTLYQTLAAHDLVTVEARPSAESSIRLTSNDPRVPLDARNTVWKALGRAMAATGGHWAVHAHIDKQLPIRGGLGAGSANAAAALVAWERETGRSFAPGEQLRIAAEVGSDVPLFLVGGAVLGTGRGEIVTPVPDLVEDQEIEVVLALPDVGVSTPEAFRAWDEQAAGLAGPDNGVGSGALTGSGVHDRLWELSRIYADALCEPYRSSGVTPPAGQPDLARHPLAALVRTGIRNDFEPVVFGLYPSLRTIKEVCERAQPLYAALSGSGSALFALFQDQARAARVQEELRALGVRSLRTRFISRAQYWRQLFV